MISRLWYASKSAPDGGQEISTLTLLLCLFIMLLAFFIVLASHATYRDEKVTEVLQSIDQTFAGRVFREGLGPSFDQKPDRGSGAGQELEQLEALFRARIPGADIRRIPDRGVLSVEMDREKFSEVLNDTQEKTGASPTQDGGLAVLLSPSKGRPLQMEIWMSVPDNLEALSIKDRQEKMKELSAWAQLLQSRGVEAGRITIGFQAGPQGRVQLLFRPFMPYAPSLPQTSKAPS